MARMENVVVYCTQTLPKRLMKETYLTKKKRKKKKNAKYDSVLQSKVFIVLLRIIARRNCYECLGINLRNN